MPLPECYELLVGEDRDRWPPEARLICAAHDGNVREIKKIAEELDVQGQGIPVMVASTAFIGMNALHAAGGRGSLPVYEYLVEEVKMDIHTPDTTQGYTPIEHAVKNGHLPAVSYLLDRGADLHQRRSSLTLLNAAAIHGKSEIVKFLLSKGADVDAISHIGTPLALASLKGHGGANVSANNPLAKAAEKNLTEAIKCLLEAGANPNVVDGNWLLSRYTGRCRDSISFYLSHSNCGQSVYGIIKHVEMEIKQLEDDNFVEKRISDLKQQAGEAFKKQDYLNASVFYTEALKMDNFEAKLLSNRSLCWLRRGDGKRAYEDAAACKKLRLKWAKAHYREGAALMFTKDYAGAYRSLSRALELDPESEEIKKLFWEAMELK